MSEEHANLPALSSGSQQMQKITAGGRPSAIIAHTMEDAYRLAKAVCMAGLAPSGMESPEACMVAIMMGAEVGLTPMTSIQRIAVINKRPSIFGDAALGLVRASGLLEAIDEQIIGEGDSAKAICTVKRKHEKPIARDFSVADARRARLWDKSGPWKDYPKRMLQMRARAFALRDVFPDVLGGMYIAEELQGSDTPRDPEPGPEPVNPMKLIEGEKDVTAEAGGAAAGASPSDAETAPAVRSDPVDPAQADAAEPLAENDAPAEDAETLAASWIEQLATMNVEQEIRDYMTDHGIWEAVEAGKVSRRTGAQIEQAFNDAMARAAQSTPPNPMVSP